MSAFSWESLRRNWAVAVSGVVLSAGLSGASVVLLPASYGATSQLVLLPPLNQQNSSYNGVVNPYMGLDGLESMASVVASAMMDNQTANTLKAAGVSSYSVQYNALTAGPVLVAQVSAPSPRQANAAIAALDRQVPATVAQLQNDDSIAHNSFITARVISSPTVPARSAKSELRVAVLVLVVGLVLTLLACSVINAWRLRRHGSPGSTGSGGSTGSAGSSGSTGSVGSAGYRAQPAQPAFTPAGHSGAAPGRRS